MIFGLEWTQWELIILLLFAITITAMAAWDAGKPRRMPRRPLPRPRGRYPKHAQWTAREGTRGEP